MTNDNEPTKPPLTFSNNVKKEEMAIREEEKTSFDKLSDMKGIIKPMPDSIKLAHPKPAFTEAIDSMLQAVAKLLKGFSSNNNKSTRP